MTIHDANKLLLLAKANYFNAFKNMSEEEKYLLVQSWTVGLQDIPVEIVFIAFFQLLSKSKWLPTLAEIREQVGHLHYEAESMLQQTRFMSEVDCLCEHTIQSTENQRQLNKLVAVANEIYNKTGRLTQTMYSNDNGLSLSSMLHVAVNSESIEGNLIHDLFLPPKEDNL